MKVQQLNVDTGSWEDVYEPAEDFVRNLRVVLSDGTVFDLADDGKCRMEIRVINGTIAIDPRSANVIRVSEVQW